MSVEASQSESSPAFTKCPRCGYSLRGLPADHACPECGLRYDERCALYQVTNPRQVLVLWVAILGGGWIVLRNLPHAANFAAASALQKLGAVLAVLWFFFVGIAIWFLVKRYRRGFDVAVTSDGLLVRLPGFSEDLVPWNEISDASIEEKPENKPQVASVVLKAKQKKLDIGGVYNVFPTRERVESFVKQVNQRIADLTDEETA